MSLLLNKTESGLVNSCCILFIDLEIKIIIISLNYFRDIALSGQFRVGNCQVRNQITRGMNKTMCAGKPHIPSIYSFIFEIIFQVRSLPN